MSIGVTLNKILSSIQPVDLVEVLTVKIEDPLLKYRREDDVDRLKVPANLYHVAIVHELMETVESLDLGFAQEHGSIYIYSGKYWEEVSTEEMRSFLSGVAKKFGYYSAASAKTHSFIDGLLKQFTHSINPLRRTKNEGSKISINLLNGTLWIDEHGCKLQPHSKADSLTYHLPFAYEPDQQCPQYLKYLDRVLPDKSLQAILQEFHGYVFTKEMKLEKALILLGEGANGKSVQFEITRSLFGAENVSTKSLGDLVDRDSGNDNRAKLRNKLLNYGSEIRADQMDIDMFKRLVSGEPVAAREKYKTSFDLENQCKFIFNANRLPNLVEHSHAYFRRFLILPYEQIISEAERDPSLHTKIISTELSGILNWVIEGLQRLLIQKDFTQSQKVKDEIERYQKESNIILQFLENERITPDPNKKVSNNILYKGYGDWCIKNGVRKESSMVFSKELNRLGYESYRTAKERGFRAAWISAEKMAKKSHFHLS